jgi:putative FmdB family regulatory protein
MPAYEYECGSCEVRFERRQKMSDSALETCPECGGRLKRLISGGAGAITRGSSQASSYAPPQCGMAGGPCCGGACMADGAGCEQ